MDSWQDGGQDQEKVRKKRSKEPFRASWVKAENLHLTLNFLGEITEQEAERVKGAMVEASGGLNAFDLTVGNLHGVPDLKRPKMLWLGLDEGTGLERLRELKQKLDHELDKIGIRAEKRSFKPHLTLCRIRENKEKNKAGSRLSIITEERQEIIKKKIDFTVDSFVLFSSRLNPGGALHRPVFTVQLLDPESEKR